MKIIKKHPLAIRWFHWINFPVLFVMIWSGLLIYWANDVYRLGWGDTTILKFFPDSFHKALNLPFRLAEGMNFHFLFMWLFALNGFIYVLYLIFSGEWELIAPNRKSLKESWQVILHDLHIRKELPVKKKYNAAQRLAYTGVIIMGLGSLLTGLAIYKPVQFNILCNLLGGYEWARAEHFILTILFSLFFLVHIIQVIIAGWNNFKGMITGFEVISPHKPLKTEKNFLIRMKLNKMVPYKQYEVSSKTIRNKTLISFVIFILLAVLAIVAWKWLRHQPKEMGAIKPIRKVLNYNEDVFSKIYSNNHLTKTYPLSAAVKKVRVNGNLGMNKDFNAEAWKLKVEINPGDTLLVTLDEIKALPKTEIVFDFKCIEGWSQVTHWGGVKFSDFVARYGLNEQIKLGYSGLITPDKRYYVGIDMSAMMHPQTLLCYEMNGKPLPMNQGFPLRLIIPVKYGIKHIKRIGTISFSNERPPDYWYEKGYDYYSGL